MKYILSPIPKSLNKDILNAAEILSSFIKPKEAKLINKAIPHDILDKCCGIAVISVLKGGFMWSGSVGSGLVVARLPNGNWSPPSAIAITGAGFGGLAGAEITEFVMILRTPQAVKAFSHRGNITLGTNISIAAGPVGRSVEASGSLLNTAPILSYSKSKGIFAGVSLEGSVIIERKDANQKFYNRKISAQEILAGAVPYPQETKILYSAIESRNINGKSSSKKFGTQYNFETSDRALPEYSQSQPLYTSINHYNDEKNETSEKLMSEHNFEPNVEHIGHSYKAIFDFPGVEDTDLPFRKGDLITVTAVTPTRFDWWSGLKNGKEGQFPANFIEIH
ncbi:hypothetical protein BB558_000751 [Smittium angustum]|uniref:SH3 domain-containing protein n=1 Tax=Smittium angustum TaxID=133377 RepID=A0A2U1JDA2_SMIAN|nr:hypothetical protein BB558_000751 [Smittium angustum]